MDWKNGSERLAEINPQYRSQKWHWDIVKDLDAIKNKSYYKKSRTFEIENFDPGLIVGTDHASYKNFTWLQMLEKLTRYESAKVCSSKLLNAYINDTRGMWLEKYGDEYYITGNGNHRFCVAKLSEQQIKRVPVTEYIFDQEKFRIDNWFESRNIQIMSRDSEKSCFAIYLSDTVLAIDRILVEEFMNTYETFKTSTLERVKFALVFGKSNRKSINNVEDLKTTEIRKLIAKHKNTSSKN